MMFKKKILITGGNGYIGNYITKMIAFRNLEYQIISMNRKNIEEQKKIDPNTTKFSNVKFISADALKPDTYPNDLKTADSIIHTVGSLIEGVNYQKILKDGFYSISS